MRKITDLIKNIFILLFSVFILSRCTMNPDILSTNDTKNNPDLRSSMIVTGAPKSGFTANVMAPLKVNNWSEFDGWLTTAKSMGVDAVSVDVWWGDTEPTDNQFNWSYYDTIFSKIKAKGLKIVPIMSFHQCGGNVGDTYTSYLPSWIWNKGTDMKYKSEQGNYSSEIVSLWSDSYVMQDYLDFMNNFEDHFATYSSDILELNLSCGPAGELRYPSYNSHDTGTGYPTKGAFQGYSDSAVNDFRNWTKLKYTTIQNVQNAWLCNPVLTGWNDVKPPSNMATFWNTKSEVTQYGKDLFEWYNNALTEHGKRMINYAIAAFNNSMSNIDLGYKISGIHWRMADSNNPRAAELNGGLIPRYSTYLDSNGNGYDRIIGVAASFKNQRKVIAHFTCLEMDDNGSDPYSASLAKTLVFWVGNEAGRQDVYIKGENALSGGVTSDHGWDNIDNVTYYSNYIGLTTLRISDVISGTGKTRYEQYILKYKGNQWASLYIRGTNNNWGLSPMNKNGDVWFINGVKFGISGSERFKFDVKGDWSINYGGNGLEGTAIQNGNDITVANGMTYDIIFNEKTKYYKVTLVPTIPTNDLVVHFKEWESATKYYVHCWDGLTGDFEMIYEGQFNGNYWWKVTIHNAPSSFKFCFKNSNNNWDGGNRNFTNQASEIYVKAWDNTIYTYR